MHCVLLELVGCGLLHFQSLLLHGLYNILASRLESKRSLEEEKQRQRSRSREVEAKWI
jgi:hypothetical protein